MFLFFLLTPRMNFLEALLESTRGDLLSWFSWPLELRWIYLTSIFLFLLLLLNDFFLIYFTFPNPKIFLLPALFIPPSKLLSLPLLSDRLFSPPLRHLLNEQNVGFCSCRSYSNTDTIEWWDSSVWIVLFGNLYCWFNVLYLYFSVIYSSRSFFWELNLCVCCWSGL